MTTLQQFIEQYYNKEVEEIDISKQSSEIWTELAKPETEVVGDRVDLSDYSNLKRLRINATLLESGMKYLTLNNPELTLLAIVNNTELRELDISGCSKLKTLKLNHYQPNNLPYIFKYDTTKIIGWKDTKLADKSKHDRLQEIIQTRIEEEGEESWKHDKIFSSDTEESNDGEVIEREEVIEVSTDTPQDNNRCNIL